MLFSSNTFLFAFLPFVLLAYFFIRKIENKESLKLQNLFLLLASLFFYSWGEAHYLLFLLISILMNFVFGIVIEKNRKLSVMVLGLALNLFGLVYFKYFDFLTSNLNLITGLKIPINNIILPIGISFFTFHSISYLIDIYRQKCKAQRSFIDLALYISFFPQLIAGPIVRYNFIAKYLAKRRVDDFFIAYGIRIFIIGLSKKVIIANPLGQMADAVFNSPIDQLNSWFAWVGIICYALQIYFDFSGYSQMAIGLARIFGFRFPQNFNYPYISTSIKEFWRRWHISLSTWFRDYVYIPLGGNRVSKLRQYINLVIVFFLCGLWHGASWNFVIWGLFHGSFLVIERLISGFKVKPPAIFCYCYAMLIVLIGWVFFRSPDLKFAIDFLELMFGDSQNQIVSSNLIKLQQSHFFICIFVLALIGAAPLVRNLALKLIRKKPYFIWLHDIFLLGCLLLVAIRLSIATHNPFIYFQF